jgi:hypothetical protein
MTSVLGRRELRTTIADYEELNPRSRAYFGGP